MQEIASVTRAGAGCIIRFRDGAELEMSELPAPGIDENAERALLVAAWRARDPQARNLAGARLTLTLNLADPDPIRIRPALSILARGMAAARKALWPTP